MGFKQDSGDERTTIVADGSLSYGGRGARATIQCIKVGPPRRGGPAVEKTNHGGRRGHGGDVISLSVL